MWRIEKLRKAILDKNIYTCFQDSEFLTQEIREKVLQDVNQNTPVRNIVENALASALVLDDKEHFKFPVMEIACLIAFPSI